MVPKITRLKFLRSFWVAFNPMVFSWNRRLDDRLLARAFFLAYFTSLAVQLLCHCPFKSCGQGGSGAGVCDSSFAIFQPFLGDSAHFFQIVSTHPD